VLFIGLGPEQIREHRARVSTIVLEDKIDEELLDFLGWEVKELSVAADFDLPQKLYF